MSPERKIELYGYLQNYMYQKENHDDYIDYYELCGFQQQLSVVELYKKMRNIKRVLHPDQAVYVEEIFQPSFIELTEEVKKMDDIFSSFRLKEEYDAFLKKKKEASKIPVKDDEKLNEIMETVIAQDGISFGLTSLMSMVFLDNHQEISKDQSILESFEKLGKDRIISVIKSKNKDIMDQNLTNMVMNYYVDVLNQSGQKERIDSFYQVCFNTSKKYDKADKNYQLENALIRYINMQSADGFTNEEGGRTRFVNSNLTSNDISILMLVKIHEYRNQDQKYSYSNMLEKSFFERVRTFANIVSGEVKENKTGKKNTL